MTLWRFTWRMEDGPQLGQTVTEEAVGETPAKALQALGCPAGNRSPRGERRALVNYVQVPE